MDLLLNAVECRVLGALVEKEITTPEYYPLTMNALINACNQKSNREPVMSLSEDDVTDAIDSLREKGLALLVISSGSRVDKFSHRLSEKFNFDRRETAVMCTLLLRGPQTAGELRGRTERMYRFDDLEGVEATLNRLAERGLAKRLTLQRGTKEPRWGHLLSGDVIEAPTESIAPPERASHEERISRLEAEFEELKRQLSEFRRQFE